MRTPIALVAATAVLLAACGGQSDVIVQSAGGTEQPTGISVSGEGRVTGVPDTLTVNIGVSLMRETVGEAVSEAAELADGVIGALRGQGVADGDIQTTNYSIFPEYDYRGGRERLIGYRVSNRVSAKIRDLDQAGEVIDAATAVGGDETVVSGVFFSLEDNEELLQLARAAAWSDAESKATQLAGLAGAELGAPTTIRESLESPFEFDEFGRFEIFSSAAADFETPIRPGQLDVTVILQVQFGID
ncbi:MAG: SIMPL domain-containing protein [Acidimicrobiia bacterium]